ncbi:hypothetical protein B0T22DRAFT_531747, partial [Podospora appendiculata]
MSERILISVGSIGAFILICFITFIVWRTMKKSKKRGGNTAKGRRNITPTRVIARMPFLKQNGWQNLSDSSPASQTPPSYREKSSFVEASPAEGFYGQEKKQLQQQQQQQQQLESKDQQWVDAAGVPQY